MTITGARPEDLDANGQYTLVADVSALRIRALPAVAAQYKANAASITAEVDWVDQLAAPISAGTELGTVRYQLNGSTIYSFALKTTTDILETAIVQPVGTDSAGSSGGSLLTTPSQPSPDAPKGGASFLIYLLLALIALVALFLIVVVIIRARKRAAARRRRQRRLEQQRRMQQRRDQQYRPQQRR